MTRFRTFGLPVLLFALSVSLQFWLGIAASLLWLPLATWRYFNPVNVFVGAKVAIVRGLVDVNKGIATAVYGDACTVSTDEGEYVVNRRDVLRAS